MILNVNDFCCEPDGRFLERAAVDAGSTALTDLDSTLRPSDVGKHIAIPGAADLVAKIVGLSEQREITGAEMSAGSHVLTGTLINPEKNPPVVEPFVKDMLVGRRITVQGAGSGNSTLVTDILDFQEPNQLILAKQSVQAVSGVKVILNKPNHVALDDYARRCVNQLTIELKDRTIHDGEMIIGGRALFSETAKFSSLDLETCVTIREAGLHVTTIQSVQNSSQATLTAPAQRQVVEGQADIWKTDSRPGFELLLSSLESQEIESAEILFSPGVYDFTRSPNGSMNAAMGLLRKKNLTIRGAGPGVTILRLMPQQDLEHANTHLIETRDCKHLQFCDLSLHGAYLTMSKTNEQMHGLFLNQGSEDILVERVRVFQSAGDGIRFLGRKANAQTNQTENKVRNVRVENCQLIQNKRSGLAFQRAVEFITVRHCYIEMIPPSTDSCIDLEPSGLPPTDIVIESNILKHATPAPAVSLSGSESPPDPARRIKFSGNELTGGSVFCTDVNELTIQNNSIRVTPVQAPFVPSPRPPISIALGGDSVVITGNLLVNDDPSTKAVIFLGGTREVKRALVANNVCFARAGGGIECSSGHDVTIEGNMIVATDICNNGIRVRSQSSQMDGISVRDNDVTVQGTGKWETGIHISADPNPLGPLSIIGNSIRHAKRGIVFDSNAYSQEPVCALNQTDDVQVPFLDLAVPLLNIVSGGITSRGGPVGKPGAGRFIVGHGNPNGHIVGNIGDIFQSLDGAQINKALWVKDAGDGTTSGWNPK